MLTGFEAGAAGGTGVDGFISSAAGAAVLLVPMEQQLREKHKAGQQEVTSSTSTILISIYVYKKFSHCLNLHLNIKYYFALFTAELPLLCGPCFFTA